MAINWDYIAGFFDGEGSAKVYAYRRSWRIDFANTNRALLEQIQDFMGTGRIRVNTKSSRNGPCYHLVVGTVEGANIVLPELLARCIIKQDDLREVATYVATRHRRADTYGVLEKAGPEEIRRLHVDEGMTCKDIAKLYDCSAGTLSTFLKRHNIPARTNYRVHDAGVDEIRRLHWDEGLSTIKIAERLGVNHSSVSAFMHRNDIPMRRTWKKQAAP